MRQRNHSAKAPERRGKVLFITADREYFVGRAQNYLLSEHIEKFAHTFDAFAEVPGFSAIVSNARWATTTATSTSVATPTTRCRPNRTKRAHVLGGMPRAEVQAKAAVRNAWTEPIGAAGREARRYRQGCRVS